MQGKAVLDASVIASLHFPDEFTEWVERTLPRFSEFLTVDLAYCEIANVAWKRITLFGEPRDAVLKALSSALEFMDVMCEIRKARELIDDAIRTALRLKIVVYDALYIALAERTNSALMTTDLRLVRRLKQAEVGLVLVYPESMESKFGASHGSQ